MKKFILLFLLLNPIVKAQSQYACPDNVNNSQNDSFTTVNYFLNSDATEQDRIQKNLQTLEDQTIQTLSGSSYDCYKLNTFREIHFKEADNSQHFTYYRISDYYFIVGWYSVNTTRRNNITVLDDEYELYTIWGY